MCFVMIPSIAAVVFQAFLSWVNAFFPLSLLVLRAISYDSHEFMQAQHERSALPANMSVPS
jgi:hypothetical protein